MDQEDGDDAERPPDGDQPRAEPVGTAAGGSSDGGGRDDDDEIAFDFIPPVGGSNDDDGGDDDDDATVYFRYYKKIFRFFRTKVPSNAVASAEDLTATVFMRFIERRRKGPLVDKHGQRFSIKGFLYGTACKVLLEHLRQVTKHSKLDDIGRKSIESIGRGLSSQAAHDQRLALVHEGLRCLPFYEQLVIECCSYHEMSYKDVAALLDVPMGSVATYNHRGRRNLKTWMSVRQMPRSTTNSADDDARRRSEELAAYPWYEPSAGCIDSAGLCACVTRDRCKPSSAAELPAWFLALELPVALPNASFEELWNLVYSVWKTWIAAGSPSK